MATNDEERLRQVWDSFCDELKAAAVRGLRSLTATMPEIADFR